MVPREGLYKLEDTLPKQQLESMMQGQVSVVNRDGCGQGKSSACKVFQDPPWKRLLGKDALEDTCLV